MPVGGRHVHAEPLEEEARLPPRRAHVGEVLLAERGGAPVVLQGGGGLGEDERGLAERRLGPVGARLLPGELADLAGERAGEV